MKLTEQQEKEIRIMIKNIKEDEIKYKCKVNYIFANKCSTEEMMMKVALSYNE